MYTGIMCIEDGKGEGEDKRVERGLNVPYLIFVNFRHYLGL